MAMDGLYHEPTAPPLAVGHIHRAPSSLTDTVDVTVEDFGDHPWGPCGWSTRGTLLPPVGAECLVAFDNHGNAWVVAWR